MTRDHLGTTSLWESWRAKSWNGRGWNYLHPFSGKEIQSKWFYEQFFQVKDNFSCVAFWGLQSSGFQLFSAVTPINEISWESLNFCRKVYSDIFRRKEKVKVKSTSLLPFLFSDHFKTYHCWRPFVTQTTRPVEHLAFQQNRGIVPRGLAWNNLIKDLLGRLYHVLTITK